jgi:hypothetical protein
MRDWKKLVGRGLAGLALEPPERAAVIAELAAHLEETCQVMRGQGLTEKEAVRHTLSQIEDWQELRHKIVSAKKGEYVMEKRARQVWIPGFVALILSMLCLAMLQKLGFQPRIVSSGSSTILLYGPWLISLPFFGALGAYVSLLAGGSRAIALLSTVFPVAALTAAFLLMFPIGLTAELLTRRQSDFPAVAALLLGDGIGWLLIPGVALFSGGLLAHLLFSLRRLNKEAHA